MERLQAVREAYRAYETGERSLIEPLLSEDFTFYSPADVGIDRERYWERCWPNAQRIGSFQFKRLAELGDEEVLVTYECTKREGARFQNTELFSFRGEKIIKVEVYFGWDLD